MDPVWEYLPEDLVNYILRIAFDIDTRRSLGLYDKVKVPNINWPFVHFPVKPYVYYARRGVQEINFGKIRFLWFGDCWQWEFALDTPTPRKYLRCGLYIYPEGMHIDFPDFWYLNHIRRKEEYIRATAVYSPAVV